MNKTYTFLPAKAERPPSSPHRGEEGGRISTASGFHFPGPRDRVTVNGMTGSGKSTFAMWLFASAADFDRKPWIFLDFKGEPLIEAARDEGMFKRLSIGAGIPKHPGVYVVQHQARTGLQPVVDFLWKIYEHGKVGLILDEATMVPELRGEANSGGPFQSILSQGRSKEIPCWVLAQRPAHVNRMVFTENTFYSAFRLRSQKDYEKILDEIPESSRDFERVWGKNGMLPKYWSRWYDAEHDRSFILKPCPPPEKILDLLWDRLDKAKETEDI